MKIFKILFVALVAMCGFASCNDCDHDFIEVDYSNDIVGTWTCQEANYAAAFVFKADGTAFTTGVENGEYWENVQVNWKVVNNKLTLNYGDNTSETLLEIISGEYLSISDKNGDRRKTYKYCANDLADEIIGMWVCTQLPIGKEGDMLIQTFQEGGKLITTGRIPEIDDYVVTGESNYKVFGDLYIIYGKEEGKALVFKFNVAPNASELGDMMTVTGFMPTENGIVEETSTWLRVKQHLDLEGQKYDYIKTFVSNVKGEDKDIPFLNTSFNFAKMDGSIIDKFLKSILFTVEFPEANKIKYSYLLEGNNIVIDAPIEVNGNKMTIKMSANNPAYQDVDMYAFQDQDNTQMHWYMPTTSFEKFFGNTSVALMLGYGQLDNDDTEGIANVYKTIADAVESINLSIVMSQSK